MSEPIHLEYGEEGGPPTSNPGWYRGDSGQWRLDPVRRPSFWREGQHAILGVFIGLLPFLVHSWGLSAGFEATLVAQVLVTLLFLAYEITEGWRIRDFAYRDIGGYLGGFVVGVCVGAFGVVQWVERLF